MFQQQAIGVYMAKQCKTVQSYLITLVDGTGSMEHEYELMIKVHQEVFSDLGNQKMDYQWEEDIYPFLPFRGAGSGNISNTFKVIFQKLLNEVYPSNITILFVCDGQRHFDLMEIIEMIEEMKKKYLIQFICVALSAYFPSQTCNTLRNYIHNQNESCPFIFIVDRKHLSSEDLFQKFSYIFKQVKCLLQVQETTF